MGISPSRTILVVEDHAATRAFLADNLTADGFEIFDAETMGDARRLLTREVPDLMLLDLGLPDGDGLDLVRQIREGDGLSRCDPDLPVIALTGRAGELQRLRGFRRGCDDYIQKPFSYAELCARLDALLRRCRVRHRGGRIRVGPLELDAVARAVWVDGSPVSLRAKEFALLQVLAAEPSRVFTREELLRLVWGFQAAGTTRTLDSHASRVRRKLSEHGAHLVVNVWGVGYRLLDPRATG